MYSTNVHSKLPRLDFLFGGLPRFLFGCGCDFLLGDRLRVFGKRKIAFRMAVRGVPSRRNAMHCIFEMCAFMRLRSGIICYKKIGVGGG